MGFLIAILTLIAFVTSFISTYFVKNFATKHGLVDDPRHRKHPAQIHKAIIPRAGGLSVLLGILVPILFFLPLNKALVGILLGAIVTVVIGLIDDKKDLNPYIRFAANVLSALFVIGAGVGIPYINNPFNGVIHLDTVRITFDLFGEHSVLLLADIFALLFIVWTMNVVGWSSGVDGQLPGFVSIALLVLGVLSLRFTAHDISQWVVTSLSFITMGSYLGFLPWNFYPQKIMPGYGGKTLAGFMLAVLSILAGAKVGTMILVLGLPMSDALYTVIRRIMSGKSPVWADRSHFHHRLLDKGWGKRRIALFYWLIAAMLGAIALTVSSEGKLFVLLTVLVIVGGVLLWTSRATKELIRTSARSAPKSSPRNRH